MSDGIQCLLFWAPATAWLPLTLFCLLLQGLIMYISEHCQIAKLAVCLAVRNCTASTTTSVQAIQVSCTFHHDTAWSLMRLIMRFLTVPRSLACWIAGNCFKVLKIAAITRLATAAHARIKLCSTRHTSKHVLLVRQLIDVNAELCRCRISDCSY